MTPRIRQPPASCRQPKFSSTPNATRPSRSVAFGYLRNDSQRDGCHREQGAIDNGRDEEELGEAPVEQTEWHRQPRQHIPRELDTKSARGLTAADYGTQYGHTHLLAA
ncbi:MAG TPA: hypothetical protein VNJ04_17135 [Gemmatimonadaceae bacterium]|nr:hypothetical protein [Gemmatimonadaceae bacterium]